MAIELAGGYDGANPQDPASIEMLAEGCFRVRAFSEDGDTNYKFALNVRATNTSTSNQPFTLEIEWDDLLYTEDRRFVYVGRGDDWAFVPARVDGSVVAVQYELPPGVTYIGQSPAYGLGDYQAFAAKLPRLGFELRVIGHSEQGREVEAFHVGQGQRQVLVTARFHPYETAASFCVEGLMTWLAAPGSVQEELLRAFRFLLVPMANPDGVYLGLCKRTGLRGVDLAHEGACRGDATARALMELVDEARPAALLDIHGWMYFEEDGLHYQDDALSERFQATLAGHPLFQGNIWKGSRTVMTANDGSTQHYCARMYGTEGLSVSYRWPSRTVAQMRALGGPTLQAFCGALPAV